MTTRIYSYGLLPPTVNAEIVLDSMLKAHRYYNKLIEIERERRTRVREVLGQGEAVAALTAELALVTQEREGLRTAVQAARRETRTRTAMSNEATAKVRALGARAKELRAQIRVTKTAQANDPTTRAALTAIEAETAEKVKQARAACGVYWGTYLIVEQAVDAARKSLIDPRFRRWEGRKHPRMEAGVLQERVITYGRVSAQIQGGISIEELWGGDTRVQIDPVPPETYASTIGVRRRLSRTTLRLRVGSDGRAPIWAEWPLILHRPLPPGARIKIATVRCERRDCVSERWSLHLTLDIPDGTLRPTCGEGAIALNLGWAQTERTGLRAGYLVAEDNKEVVVSPHPSVMDRIEAADAIRSTRDKNLDELRPQLAAWLIEQIIEQQLPDWLRERTQFLIAWRSADRFRDLANYWRCQRWAGDEIGFQLLWAWRYRDEHLERYESNMRSQALRDRRETYRKIAADLATRYRTLIIDDTDLRTFQRSPKPEQPQDEIPTVKRNQRYASPSELRQVLISAFSGSGAVVKLKAENVTRRCFHCGSLEEWDRTTAGRNHTCSACHVEWDQDANACRNLLRAYEQHVAEAASVAARGTAEPQLRKESRSERLRRHRIAAQPSSSR